MATSIANLNLKQPIYRAVLWFCVGIPAKYGTGTVKLKLCKRQIYA
jgi:hypothetical protein